MTGRLSAATERALAHIESGATAYRAAKNEGIALSTIYRALKKEDDTPRARVVLSTALLLEEGTFRAKKIGLAAAKAWLAAGPYDNFCGHATARILGIEPTTTRAQCLRYDEALCLKPAGRLEFGREYTAEEIDAIGVEFTLIRKIR